MVNVDEFIAHYGVKGMKWGVINEERDDKINEKHGKVYDAANKIGATLGIDKAKDNVAAKEEKAAADKGIKQAESRHERFNSQMEYYNDPKVKIELAEDHLWDMRGKMSYENMVGYERGDVEAVEKIYQAAKQFDLLMNQYAEKNGTTLDDDETIASMQKDSEELDDLYNELKDRGVKYPEEDPEYAKKMEEAESNLDKYADHVASTLGIPNDDKEAYQRIKDDFKVLWFNTGYTNIAGHDNTDWSQYGRRNDRREQRKKDKNNIEHSEIPEFIELPYLEHSGIRGMKWGVQHGPPYPLDSKVSSKIKSGKSVKGKSSDDDDREPRYDSGTKNYKSKDARHLTDEELKRRVARLTQENNYRDQLKKNKEADMTKRQKLVQKIFVDSAANAASTVMQNVYTKAATSFINERFPALSDNKKKKS